MSVCTKNRRKLLGILPYRGPHKWKIVRVEWDMVWWSIDRRCIYCKAVSNSFGHSDVDMIARGFDIEKLREAQCVSEDRIQQYMEVEEKVEP